MEMISKLTKDSILDEEVFDEIFSQEDEICKARLTLTLLDRAKELGVKKKFEDLLKAYTKVQKQMIEKEKSSKAVSMLDQWTNFSDCEYDRMKCLNWIADDDGIRISNTNPGSPDIIACYHPILPIERMKNLETGEEQIKLIYKRNNKWSEVIVPKTMVASSIEVGDNELRIFADDGETIYDLGSYSTKAKAMKVLDMIQEAYADAELVPRVFPDIMKSRSLDGG